GAGERDAAAIGRRDHGRKGRTALPLHWPTYHLSREEAARRAVGFHHYGACARFSMERPPDSLASDAKMEQLPICPDEHEAIANVAFDVWRPAARFKIDAKGGSSLRTVVVMGPTNGKTLITRPD